MATISEALAIAIQHHEGGRLQAAEQIYRQILRTDPNHAEAWHLLGVIAHQAGKDEAAVESIRRAIALSGESAGFHYNLAKVYEALGRIPEAASCYRRTLELKPDFAEAHQGLGNAYKVLGKLDDAVACYHMAVELNPDDAEALRNLGSTLRAQGKCGEAVPYYRRVVALKPAIPEAHNNLGVVLRDCGAIKEAIASYRRAVELNPTLAEAHYNLGIAWKQHGKVEEAISSYRRAVELKPGFTLGLNNLGNALKEAGKLEEAVSCYREALEAEPSSAVSLNNLGAAVEAQGKLEEAIGCYRRAMELEPEFAAACNNLGLGLKEQGKLHEAEALCRRAVELKPDFAEAHNNVGLFHLLFGRYEEGWKEYEHRLALTPSPRRFSEPRWNGERVEGGTILVCSEQGYGDVIHFARYLPLVRQRSGAGRVVLETPPPLVRLLAQNGGWDAEIASGGRDAGSGLPPCDAQVPLLSLPLALGVFKPLPMTHEYLRADPVLRREWRDRLGRTRAKRVGVAWAGSELHNRNRLRSMEAGAMEPLWRVPGCELYSLQVDSKNRTGLLRDANGIIDLSIHISDFADTAALLAELDLVITVDTAVAHLAGAMGRPVWTLLPFLPDWRWGVEGGRTPLYPTMRLFRQRAVGDWDEVVRRVAAELGGM